jgi:hypothetical protein
VQSITAKRRAVRASVHERTLEISGVRSLLLALEVFVIFLSVAVSIALPLYFGNEADKLGEIASIKEHKTVFLESRLEDMTREIAFLETVAGMKAEK